MNILNIFNNLVTLGSPHSPTHTLPKQPQCSYKYNVYQHIAPASQGNPPMSAASEESTADFLPKALQTGKKGDRAAETGRQKRGDRNGRQKRAAGPGRQKRGGRNGAAETGRQEADAGERAEGSGSRRLASKKAGQEHRKTEYGQEKPETEHKNPKTETGSPKTGRESPETGRGAGCRRDRHSESEADRAGTKQKKGNSESRLIVRHPQFPHQPKTTNLNEP
ncbi:MAG TPA: hypothetical protein H9933_05425 [Candidatus Alistipes merdavium]|nr:hypothetical protein [Candidatus Alistipes merdavium]